MVKWPLRVQMEQNRTVGEAGSELSHTPQFFFASEQEPDVGGSAYLLFYEAHRGESAPPDHLSHGRRPTLRNLTCRGCPSQRSKLNSQHWDLLCSAWWDTHHPSRFEQALSKQLLHFVLLSSFMATKSRIRGWSVRIAKIGMCRIPTPQHDWQGHNRQAARGWCGFCPNWGKTSQSQWWKKGAWRKRARKGAWKNNAGDDWTCGFKHKKTMTGDQHCWETQTRPPTPETPPVSIRWRSIVFWSCSNSMVPGQHLWVWIWWGCKCTPLDYFCWQGTEDFTFDSMAVSAVYVKLFLQFESKFVWGNDLKVTKNFRYLKWRYWTL